jgi:hypothetical protein
MATSTKTADMMLLYDAAVLAAVIKRMYLDVKDHPTGRYFTYVLLLQEGKIYVGSTDNIYTRLADHFLCSPSSALWVKEYGPPVRVIEISRNSRPDDETYKYTEYADKFGFENVRGGSWCRLVQNHEPLSVKNFVRKPDDDFDYLTRAEIDDIVTKIHNMM